MTTTRKLHITHIASGDLWAGAEVQIYTLCKALLNLNEVSVSVILLNHGILEQKLKEIEIPVAVLDESMLNGLQIGWLIYKQLKQQQPDIIHTHRIKENILGGLVAKMVRIPSLRTVHGSPEHRPGWIKPLKRLFYVLDWLVGQYLQSSIIAVSDDLKIRLERQYSMDKLQVIENGIDIKMLAPYSNTFNDQTKKHVNSYKIGLVGRLVPVKRVDLFIQCASYLRDHHSELLLHFHIIGDGPLRSELEELTKTLNVEDIVHFEGHCSDIYSQIASLDALLITSDHEGLPMTLLEAMALGTTVLAHSVGGIPKVCQYGKFCWLTSDNSFESFSKLVVDCCNRPETRRTRIELANKHINNNYSANENACKFYNLYLRRIKTD